MNMARCTSFSLRLPERKKRRLPNQTRIKEDTAKTKVILASIYKIAHLNFPFMFKYSCGGHTSFNAKMDLAKFGVQL